jgi:hypothetical protein
LHSQGAQGVGKRVMQFAGKSQSFTTGGEQFESFSVTDQSKVGLFQRLALSSLCMGKAIYYISKQ